MESYDIYVKVLMNQICKYCYVGVLVSVLKALRIIVGFFWKNLENPQLNDSAGFT